METMEMSVARDRSRSFRIWKWSPCPWWQKQKVLIAKSGYLILGYRSIKTISPTSSLVDNLMIAERKRQGYANKFVKEL